MSKPFFSVIAFAGLCYGANPPFTVDLHTSLPSPQAVGSPIGLVPRVENAGKGMLVFRYSVSVDNGPLHIIRDFTQQRDFVWNPPLFEHEAKLHVTARNNESKEIAEREVPFRIVPRVTGSTEEVTPTAHPLVALFSAPSCPDGSQFRVAFRPRGGEAASRTSSQPCVSSRSSNVYVAGMRAGMNFELRSEVVTGASVKAGSWMPFRTGLLDGEFPPISIPVPRAAGSTVSDPVLIHSISSLGGGKRPMATDMDGNVIWYMRTPESLTRVLPNGRFLVLSEGANSVNEMRRSQVMKEVDLAGHVIRETNISRVAEQLETRGIHSDCKKGGKECVSGFHHEALRVPGGHTLVIAGLERMFPEGTQGSKEPVDILGDLVIDLDEDFQVAGLWNSFDHFDIKRASLADAKCAGGAGRGGCPPIFLASQANGWLHSNSLNYIPTTGDFLISMPEQNWVLKIDWRNGKGTGKIVWRLGEGGDFTAKTDDPDPWFSFQHDPGFEPPGSNMLTILDDGHTRFKKDPKAHNRGQVWKLDEEARTATLMHNADLGVYAIAVGSAQTLKNGGYSFEAGFINPASPYGRAVETSADGKVVYAQQVEGLVVYRSFRVADMYTASTK